MIGKVIFLLPAFLLFVLYNTGSPGGPPGYVVETYHRADKFFNYTNPTNESDSMALAGFEEVIERLEKFPNPHYDTLLFQSYLKKGILLDIKNKNTEAKDAYLKAAAIPARNSNISDSLLFRVYVYAGTGYYNLNNFDSANYFLIKAESLIKRFPKLPEKERLYNTLGALNFVNGNYLQSTNYFNEALELIKNRHPFDSVFALALEANIATSFYKLGRYPESLSIYDKIIKEKISASYIYNGICMNMGKAYAAIKKYNEALACFHRINPLETPGVLNELALSHFELQHPDSAAYYLNRLQSLKKYNKVNMVDIGINNLYRADLFIYQQQYMPALTSLQNAICVFSNNYNNPDIYSNPTFFTGSYTYYRLFDALYKKAQTFELLNRKTSRELYLTASLAAYKSALTLLGFIEKSYATDDAKVFLKKKSGEIYKDALLVCLRLHQLHPGAGYLEEAFMISEKNKASIISANLKQRDFTSLPGIDKSFLQTERNIRYNIARLDVKSEQARDNGQIEKLAKEKAKYEIELSQLQKNLEQNNRYFRLKYEDASYSAKELCTHIGDNQALFSFYMTNESLHVFAFTQTSFSYARIDSVRQLQKETEEWINLLKASGDGRKFQGEPLGNRLYEHLIRPLQSLVPGKDEWIIIPDGNLYFLPFESLPDGNSGKTLLETTTISYQFSSRFIVNLSIGGKNENASYNVLSFAPFVKKGVDYHQAGFNSMNQLPASGEEISGLKGAQFTDSKATKSMFLQEVNKYPIIHLATHAVADVENPSASYIAFYPENKSPAENYLYLEEIYTLNLDDSKLVIISACETGKGELVNNEGIISLGRAFAYAGCESSISSLWKADDKAAAAILQKFHEYLQKGYTKSKALQRAKLDYINSDALYKSPAYWSNLTLTGSIEPVCTKDSTYKWFIITVALLGALLTGGIIIINRRKKKKSTLFTIPDVNQNNSEK
jgi:CHAT domain-containing protein